MAILSIVFMLSLVSAAFSAITVENTARADYSIGTVPTVAYSSATAIVVRTPSTLEFLKYAPLSPDAQLVNVPVSSYLDTTGSYQPLPNPVPAGSTSPINLNNPVALVTAKVYHAGEPIFLMLSDGDQNINPAVAETVLLTLNGNGGETESLLLTESGPNTGIFTGHIQSAIAPVMSGNGTLSVPVNSDITATYTDIGDSTDISLATALVDPFGVVFETSVGMLVNGATVTLVDAGTGLSAIVYGDDGVSIYPSTVTSGEAASDSSGAVYTFPPGGYRFPFISPGIYRLVVLPPPAYRVPSVVSTADILNLGPFTIAYPGSRGEDFIVNSGPAIHIDIPVDPIRTWLYLTKTASKDTVAIGDFLQYRITVQNTATININAVSVYDRLPLGFRYRTGSTKIYGVSAADPTISADGRSLTFNLGGLASGQTADITFVVGIAAGAKIGKAINTAGATGSGGEVSNTARAEVLVKEDLFGSKTIIMGRVFPNGCEESPDTDGVSGVRIYLEDGAYSVTDKKGMYHFEGLKPGTHVVQLDLDTIPKDYELISCEENDRFAGTPYSQFVDLQGGTMWRADFHVVRKPNIPSPPIVIKTIEIKGMAGIELNSILVGADSDKLLKSTTKKNAPAKLDYDLLLHVGSVPVKNLRISVILPEGVEYIKGSSSLGDSALPDPEIMENVLTYRIKEEKEGWDGKIRFSANVQDGKSGGLTTKAILTFDSTTAKNERTPIAENILSRRSVKKQKANPDVILYPRFDVIKADLKKEDMVELDSIISGLKKVHVLEIQVTGHTDSTPIAPESRHIFADNYALSDARAKSVADYIATGLGLPPSLVIAAGKGDDLPLATNLTDAGRARNRRVELIIVTEDDIYGLELKNEKDKSGLKEVETKTVKTVDPSSAEKGKEKKINDKTMPDFDSAWLDKAEPGLSFVWPYDGFHPSIPSVKIAVKHDPAKKLRLLLNGREVDSLYLDGTTKRSDNQIAVSLWIGIHIKDGDNLFEAVEYSLNGNEESRIKRTIHYSGPPVKAEPVHEKSNLIANGKMPSVIAVRLTDKDGHPAREGLIGEYKVDPPYQPLQKFEELQQSPLTMSASDRLKYVVGEDGIALIEIQPTSKTGEATLRFNLVSGEQEVRIWLTPGVRDWILVGLAEGTIGFNTVRGNMESLGDSGADDKYYDDGRIAFFAKGMIKGKWLLTVAFDSDKRGIKNNDSLHGIIDPNKYYTLYGDATQQGYEAASARSLYIKIERDQFYALFGDFDTGLNVTELSRYSRNLNGLKSEMKGEKFGFNVFASDTNQAFVKDEIRGDGTSGLYRLSRKNIVLNSESIVIETRNRFKSEEIVSSMRLSRHIDYTIDYDAGTIFFKSPIYSRDENFNPIFIVVNYESFDPADMSFNYGGRGAIRLMDNKLEIGATRIHEGMTGGDGDLTGIDAKIKLDDKTTARAEFAYTNTNISGVRSNGNAYLAEVYRRSEKLEGKFYVREQGSEFGLGQQNRSETGTRKIGFSGTYRLTEKVSFDTEGFKQYNFATDAVRDMADAQIRLTEMRYSLHVGVRHAQDTLDNGDVNKSEQLITGGSLNLLNNRVVLRLEHDQSLGNNENVDYPTRTTIGADYKLNETATLFAVQEFTQGANEDTQTTRIGMKASPWNGGELSSSLEQQYTENGSRLFAVNGLKQTWKVTEKWSLDAGLDRSETLKHPGSSQFNINVPLASGGIDFTAVSLGAAYKEEKWSWTGRIEKRDSDDEDKVGVFTGAYGETKKGIGLSASLLAFKTESSLRGDKTSGDLRLGMAYRPRETRWIVLDRLDYIFEKQTGAGFDYDNWRVVNNMNANYKAKNRRTQISLQYGAKYVNETIDGHDYSGFTDLMGLELRYDITKRFDIGLRGSILHSWGFDQYRYGYGPSIGFNLVKNVWISIGYNVAGFRDRDFSKADFTAEGPYIKFRMKFDQGSAKDAVKSNSGQ